MNKHYLDIVRRILSQPTAPYHEHAVIEQALALAAGWGVRVSRDAAGNVFLDYGGAPRPARRSRPTRAGRPKGKPPVHWVFAAHMDHPGLVLAGDARRARTVRAHFIGGVGREYFKGARVRFFGPAGEVAGTILSYRPAAKGAAPAWPACRIALDAPADLPAGTLGMWDLPAVVIRGRRLISRACDDVIGTAAALCAMDEIVRVRVDARVTVLLTRAEEDGFVGALAACRDRRLPRGARIVAIEASREQPSARPGDGAVVRVGDHSRTFDPALTAHVSAVAADLAKRDKAFRYVRQLMPGGTCESTAYLLWGYAATGLCLPLVNYHNMGNAGRIAAEQVDAGDFESLVKLLVAVATCDLHPDDVDVPLKTRLTLLLKNRERFLRSPAAR